MIKYPDAAKGVGRIYVSELMFMWIAISAFVLLVAAIVVFAFEDINVDSVMDVVRSMYKIRMTPAMIVLLSAGATLLISSAASGLLLILGVTKASRDEKAFKMSFLFLIITIVSGLGQLITSFFSEFASDGISIIFTISRFLITYYVLMGIYNLAKKLERDDVARIAMRCRNLICLTYIILACVTFLSALIQNNIGVMIVNAVIGINLILDIVCYFIYLVALRKARKMLKLAKIDL